jgi:hypothetical protein
MSPITIEETFDVDNELDELDTDTHGIDVLVVVDDHHSLGKKDQEMLRKNQ